KDIMAKRITLNPTTGLPVLSLPIVVASDPRNEHDADVAMDANGNFVVSYTLDTSSTNQDILAVRYNSAGGRIGFLHQLAQRTGDHNETRSTVAMSPDGRTDLVYQTELQSGGGDGITFNLARYDQSGNLIADAPINQGSPGFLLKVGGFNPSIAMDNAGNAVVAYQVFDHGFGTAPFPDLNVHSFRLSSSGTFVGSSSKTMNFSGNETPTVRNNVPSVALSPSGGAYVVAWDADFTKRGGAQTVEVAEVTGSDVLNFASILPASPSNFQPAVSIAGNGQYLLTYDAVDSADNKDVHGRFGQLPVAPAAQDL